MENLSFMREEENRKNWTSKFQMITANSALQPKHGQNLWSSVLSETIDWLNWFCMPFSVVKTSEGEGELSYVHFLQKLS
jgi:hypothetical protein